MVPFAVRSRIRIDNARSSVFEPLGPGTGRGPAAVSRLLGRNDQGEGFLPDPEASATVVITSSKINFFKMKKCSHCGQENADIATACSECGTEFPGPEIPEDPKRLLDPALSLAIVATFRNVVDAGLFRARLEAAGIEACIPEEYTPQIVWNVTPSPVETVTVRVAVKDYEAAKALLEDYVDTSIIAALPLAQEAEAQIGSFRPEQQDEMITGSQGQTECVSCGAVIPEAVKLCPKCGYTQPEPG